MSDNYKWDGEIYQGTPEGEKKYEYYKVGDKKETKETNETSREEGTQTTRAQTDSDTGRTAAGTDTNDAGDIGTPYQRNNSYQGNNTYQGNPYQGGGYQNSAYRANQQVPPYQQQRAKKTRKPASPTAKKFGVTISLALVFGLVAGLVFQGVNVISNKYLDTGSSSPKLQSTALVEQAETAKSGSASAQSVGANSVAAVAKSAMPSVVAITSVSVQEIPNFFGYGTQKYQGVSSGSGVIVGENEKELLIATNNHVVENTSELSVCFIGDDVLSPQQTQANLENNGGLDTEGAVSATVKGTEPSNDLAVIAVKKADIPEETMAQIKIAQIGNSDSLEVGEQVVAIGNALGYGQSVTSGYVSALNRQVTFENNNSTTMILTDAAINPGNSGGALLNMQGQLVGINSAKEAANAVEGMGYSIPMTNASPILDELMTRKTRDKVDAGKSAYMGIEVADVSEEAVQMFNLPEGAFVTNVTEDSAAEKAGIKQNDIIIKLDGQTVNGRDDLLDKLQYYKAGETIEIVVSRANEGEYVNKTLNITFAKRPANR